LEIGNRVKHQALDYIRSVAMSSKQDDFSSGFPKSWKFWVPIAISGIFSVLALVVSIYSSYISKQAREDARAVSKLDIHPIIELSTDFQGLGGKQPYFIVKNTGPIDAEQLEVQLVSHRYIPQKDYIGISTLGTEGLYRVPRLEPGSGRAFEFPKLWLEVNARIQKPAHHNAMEIRLKYRRPVDLAIYEASAFYFINPEGRWVTENDNSLTHEVYEPIKSATFRESEKELRYIGHDNLHRIVRSE